MHEKKQKDGKLNWGKIVVIGVGLLFVGSIIWSFITETLMPLMAAGDAGAVGRNLVGFPIILLGTGFIVYGGFVFVRDTFSAMADPHVQARVEQIRQEAPSPDQIRRARWQNFLFLVRAWKDGLLLMLLGFALIAVGGWLINVP